MEIEKLIKERNAILNLLASFEKYAKNPSHYDKTGMGFNLDDRFAAHNGFKLRIDTWMGVYGNSGCSTQISLNDDVFNYHLLKVLNADFTGIMYLVAESIKKDALKIKEESIKKLKDNLELVESINTD